MADVCVEKPKEIYEELRKIKDELDNIISKYGPDDMRGLAAFKKEYDRLLKLLEESKDIANCPVPVVKVDGDCEYMSPLEPLILSTYAGVPHPDEPYTIIDDIRRQAKNNRLDKIRDLISDLEDRLGAYVHGITECKIDLDAVPDDIDSVMLELGLNPDEMIEEEEEKDSQE